MKLCRSEKGAAYLWVISITLIVTLLSFALIYIVTTDFKITNSYIYGVRSYYLAESGAELAVGLIYYDIANNKNNANDYISTRASDLCNQFNTSSSNKFNINYISSTNEFFISKPFPEYNADHYIYFKIKTDTEGTSTTYTITSKGIYKDNIIRCVYVKFNVMTDINNKVHFPPYNNQNWTWQQISKDDY